MEYPALTIYKNGHTGKYHVILHLGKQGRAYTCRVIGRADTKQKALNMILKRK